MTSDAVPTGTPVNYHGTQQAHHGPATVLDAVQDWNPGNSSDGWRYEILSVHGEIIKQVRRQSFSLPDTSLEAARRTVIRGLMDDLPAPSAAGIYDMFDRAEADALQFMGTLFPTSDTDCEGR